MKGYLQVLAVLVAVSMAGCSFDPADTSAIHLHKRVFVPESAEPAGASWTPPANQLPRDFVESVTFLQSHGLADPRGGVFCKVRQTNPQNNGFGQQALDAYGWIVKGEDGRKGFIGFDGLTRHDFGASSVVNLDDFLKGLSGPSGNRNQWSMGSGPGQPFPIAANPSIEAALFLVMGRADIAAQVLPPQPPPGQSYFVDMATNLLSAKFDRALQAYSRGDDQGANNVATDLVALREPYEKEALAVLGTRGIDQLQNGFNGSRSFSRVRSFIRTPNFSRGLMRPQPVSAPPVTKPNEVFGLLDRAPVLVAETNRRLAEPPVKSLASANESEPWGTSLLIRQLENVVSPEPTLGPQPPVQLAQLGPIDAALSHNEAQAEAALIECMENDHRLSRQLQSTPEGTWIVPVRDVAFQAFVNISHAPFQQFGNNEPIPLEAVKKWWAVNKNLSPAERAYRMLADDNNNDGQWFQAASLIVARRQDWSPGNQAKPALHPFEELRNHASPSVTSLLTRRILQLLTPPPPIQPESKFGPQLSASARMRQGMFQSSKFSAEQMCDLLWWWDPAASLKPLQVLSDRLYADRQTSANSGQFFDPQLPRVLERRMELNDDSAVPLYRQMLVDAKSSPGMFNATQFHYYYLHRDEPRFRGFAQAVFLDPVLHPRPSTPTPNFNWDDSSLAINVAVSPLLGIPEERQAVLHLLQDKSPVGSIANDGHQVTEHMLPGPKRQIFPQLSDELAPPPGKSVPLRRCDEAMESLTRFGTLTGVPTFQSYWPVDVKDEAIKKLINLIESHKADETALLTWPNNWKDQPPPAPAAPAAQPAPGAG